MEALNVINTETLIKFSVLNSINFYNQYLNLIAWHYIPWSGWKCWSSMEGTPWKSILSDTQKRPSQKQNTRGT